MIFRQMSAPDGLFLAIILVYTFLCPYTKVEESFYMQGVHDLLNFGVSLDKFDHFEFPGVVPRSFIGPLLLSTFTAPIHAILHYFNGTQFASQLVCRSVLACMVWTAFMFCRAAVSKKFNSRVAYYLVVFLLLQFHIPFYSSRTLANTFALAFSMFSFGQWLEGRALRAICIIAVGMVIFRCDLVVLLVPMTLQMLWFGEITFWKGLLAGVATCVLSLALTVSIDSFFWNKWMWPEGMVLFFNTVENKSSNWGTEPWHWYASTALPKALNGCVPLVILGILGVTHPLDWNQHLPSVLASYFTSKSQNSRKLCYYITPYVVYIILYSFLPHKELRFIFPAIPPLTLAAAVGLDALLPPVNVFRKMPSFRRCCFAAVLVCMIAVAALGVVSSYNNYPGALALETIHSDILQCKTANVTVHIEPAAAMTGVTRFLQYHDNNIYPNIHIYYSKQESGDIPYNQFGYIISGQDDANAYGVHYELYDRIYSFNRFSLLNQGDNVDVKMLRAKHFPLAIELTPSLFVYKNSVFACDV